jgi:hypothetical protein
MEQRCNTDWVNERAITVQFDNQNIFESIASFLIIRPKYAWLGFGAGIVPPKWNDAFRWDVGLPKGECSQSSPGVFQRQWSYGTATMDCSTYSGHVPCNPHDQKCGILPKPTLPPTPSLPTPPSKDLSRHLPPRRCHPLVTAGLLPITALRAKATPKSSPSSSRLVSRSRSARPFALPPRNAGTCAMSSQKCLLANAVCGRIVQNCASPTTAGTGGWNVRVPSSSKRCGELEHDGM